MKLTYFALAVGGISAQSFIENMINDAVNSIYSETDNGYTIDLLPFYKEQVSTTPNSWNRITKISMDGENHDNFNYDLSWDEKSFDFNLTEDGFFSNNEWYSQINPGLFYAFDTWTGETKFSATCTDSDNGYNYGSFDLEMSAEYEFDGSDGKATTSASGSASNVVSNNGPMGNINYTANKVVTNSGYPAYVSLDAFGLGLWDTQNVNIELDVNANMLKCRKFMKTDFLSAKPRDACKVASSFTHTDNLSNSSNTFGVRFEMFSKFIALLAKESGNPDWRGVVVRGENTNNEIDFIGNHNFYGLYGVEGGQFRKQIANGNAELILRAPGCSTWENILIPHLENKMQPWGQFFQKLSSEDFSSLSNLAYHFDKFLSTFDDEFDFSEFMRLTHISSDAFGFSNEDVCNVLSFVNNEIVAALSGDEVEGAFDIMRNYVVDDLINNGLNTYQGSFGDIF